MAIPSNDVSLSTYSRCVLAFQLYRLNSPPGIAHRDSHALSLLWPEPNKSRHSLTEIIGEPHRCGETLLDEYLTIARYLSSFKMVGKARFELAFFCFRNRRVLQTTPLPVSSMVYRVAVSTQDITLGNFFQQRFNTPPAGFAYTKNFRFRVSMMKLKSSMV